MILEELINALENADQTRVCPVGFTRPHSYRGDYSCLAFEPAKNVTVATMLASASSAIDQTFTGYKGGDYLMGAWTDCWLAQHGSSGESIGPVLLDYMLGKHQHAVACETCGRPIKVGKPDRVDSHGTRSHLECPRGSPFQERVKLWMLTCFGEEIAADRLERGDRLLEETFELLQSGDYPRERVRALEHYVWSRPAGEPRQEAGGVMVTLAAYCLAHDIDMYDAGETELARVWTKIDKIRAKQAAKPRGSALPIAAPKPAVNEQPALAATDKLRETLEFIAEISVIDTGSPTFWKTVAHMQATEATECLELLEAHGPAHLVEPAISGASSASPDCPHSALDGCDCSAKPQQVEQHK